MMDIFNSDAFTVSFLGATAGAWLSLGVVWIAASAALVVLRKLLIWRLEIIARRTANVIDDVITSVLQKTRLYFLLAVALYVAVAFVPLSDVAARYITRLAFLALMIQVVSWGNHLISDWVKRFKERKLETDAAAVTTMQAVGFVARLLLYTIILLVALENFGVDVTALVAGLGVGGIAIALALQNILGDLFASLSIVLDKPFVVGDFLIMDEYLGTVEQIGLKTTRIRSLSGEQLIFSNSDLLNSRIRNFKRMFERRVVFGFGVVYQTPKEHLVIIPEMVREIVESLDDTRLDRAHFKEFGNSSLNFEVVYYVLVPEYNVYMDRQQAINLALFERFAEKGIEFAYPTQTLYIESVDGDFGEADLSEIGGAGRTGG